MLLTFVYCLNPSGCLLKFLKLSILETSRNSFVLFEIAQLIGTVLLKEWTTTDKSIIEDAFKFLLKFAAEKPEFVIIFSALTNSIT